MTKDFVIFGATGSQGGAVTYELLAASNDSYTIKAVTRNKASSKAQSLEKAGAKLQEADMNDLSSLKRAVRGASIIFAITDFIAAGNVETETQQGINLLDAALSTLDTLELFIWSSLPDARTQVIPYHNVVHFNSKNDIAKRMKASELSGILTEVRVGAYYQNMMKAPQLYGPQKLPDGSWQLMWPVNPDTQMPFTSVQDLGKLIKIMVADPAKYRTKSISVVSQRITPVEMMQSWSKASEQNGSFKSLSTEEFKQRLETVHRFPEVFATTLAENLSVCRDAPEAWIEGTDFALADLVPNLKTWNEYVKEEDWGKYFESFNSAKLV